METLETQRKKALAPLRETQSDRMQRYLDCQDDSIMYGMSWNVTSNKINGINLYYDLLEEQEKNGFVEYNTVQTILFDLSGNEVDAKIVQTQYGQAYVTNEGKFIGCAKRQSTFEKKGYKVRKFKVNLKCDFKGKTRRDKQCIYDWRPVFESIEKTYKELDFEGTHHQGITWI